jgi:hypothetical protein
LISKENNIPTTKLAEDKKKVLLLHAIFSSFFNLSLVCGGESMYICSVECNIVSYPWISFYL